MKTLVIFTGSFPFDIAKEDTFLSLEIKHLQDQFDRIIIVPERISKYRCNTPESIEIDESFASQQRDRFSRYANTLLDAILFPYLWKELLKKPNTLLYRSALTQLVCMAGGAKSLLRWFPTFISRNQINFEQTIFYTYWLGSSSFALGLIKHKLSNLKIVSRAHGYDLYVYRNTPPYIPFHKKNIDCLDTLYTISENGKKYIDTIYPEFSTSCKISRLGVSSPGFTTLPSCDGVTRIVSCSYMTAVKRLDLLLSGLISLSDLASDQRFEWCHIGDGPLMNSLQRLACSAPQNLKINFLGYLENSQIFQFYRDYPCDIFLNTSSSEGVSVAMMEAASCGIPIVATEVGGTPEIVSDCNGCLLPKHPTPRNIADTILNLVNDCEGMQRKRAGSIAVWRELYDGDNNFSKFAHSMRALITT